MKLTREILHSAGTSGIGYNREQLRLLGVPWPPRHGWLSNLVGKDIPDDTWSKVMELKDYKTRKKAQQHLMRFL